MSKIRIEVDTDEYASLREYALDHLNDDDALHLFLDILDGLLLEECCDDNAIGRLLAKGLFKRIDDGNVTAAR